MISIQIPTEAPFWSQRVTLDGREYYLRGEWNQRESFWYVGLSDQDEDVIFHPKKVVVGVDLLRTRSDSRTPPGALMAVDFSGEGRDPGFSELGERVQLVYFTAEDVAEVA